MFPIVSSGKITAAVSNLFPTLLELINKLIKKF